MGEGFEMGVAAGAALRKGFEDWRSIQLDRQNRKEFDGAMALAAQRRGMIASASQVDAAQQLEGLKSQIQRSPQSQQTARPTGEVDANGQPVNEEVIRTPEGDIPIAQLLQLQAQKQQAETQRAVAEVDLIMELQSRYPNNPYVKQWAASTYAGIQQKQQIRSKQVEAQRLQLDTLTAGLAREQFEEQARQGRARLAEEQRQFDAAPARQREQQTFETDERIRGDAARIEAQKRADLEVQAAKPAQPKDATEFVKKLQQMAPRAQQALEEIEALESGGDGVYDRTGVAAGIESLTPNALRSGKRQQYEQAQLQFINSVLRAESGATITDSELNKARDQYFPKVGDSPEVVNQKRQARRVAVENLFSAANLEAPAVGARDAGGLSAEEAALIEAVKAGKMSPDEARARRAALRGG